jgi:hypothetical protein
VALSLIPFFISFPYSPLRKFSLSGTGIGFRLATALALLSLSPPRAPDLRFDLREPLGSDVVIDVLVADMKLLLATLSIGVGNARRIRCEVGMALVGGVACEPPNTLICDGGIHGASRCILPRMC